MSIQNKNGSALGVAVVTGASAGIGKIYADRLAKHAYGLILVARRKERLEALAQELKQKYGVQAGPLVADLGNEADLKRVADVLSADERITLLVNNSGTSVAKPSIDLPFATVNNQMDVNAKSVTELVVLDSLVADRLSTLSAVLVVIYENQIPQPSLQPRRLGDLLLPNRVVMASLTRGRAAPLEYSWCDARRAADVAQASN